MHTHMTDAERSLRKRIIPVLVTIISDRLASMLAEPEEVAKGRGWRITEKTGLAACLSLVDTPHYAQGRPEGEPPYVLHLDMDLIRDAMFIGATVGAFIGYCKATDDRPKLFSDEAPRGRPMHDKSDWVTTGALVDECSEAWTTKARSKRMPNVVHQGVTDVAAAALNSALATYGLPQDVTANAPKAKAKA